MYLIFTAIVQFIPYFLAIKMPNIKWLFAYFLLWAGIIWVMIDHARDAFFERISSIPEGSMPSSALQMSAGLIETSLFASMIGAAVICGIIARLIVLFLESKNYSKRITLIPVFIGLLLAAMLWKTPIDIKYQYKDWHNRPASQACVMQDMSLEIADLKFHLPQVHYFSFIPAYPYKRKLILFGNGPEARYACKLSENATRPIKTSVIIISLRGRLRQRDRFCSASQAAWKNEICNADKWQSRWGYPEPVFIYNPETLPPLDEVPPTRYYHEFKFPGTKTTYQEYQEALSFSKEMKKDENGFVSVDGEHHYFVFDSPEHVTPDGSPYTLSCEFYESRNKVDLGKKYASCYSIYALSDNVYVQYVLKKSYVEKTPAGALKRYEKMQTLLRSLSE